MKVFSSPPNFVKPKLDRSKCIGPFSELSLKFCRNCVGVKRFGEEEFNDHALIVVHWNLNLNVS
jgi:hypothetical protein